MKRRRSQTRCSNCNREAKPLRRGRCSACDTYLRRFGSERAYIIDGRRERHPGHSGRRPDLGAQELRFSRGPRS
jgi:hypothetical protein